MTRCVDTPPFPELNVFFVLHLQFALWQIDWTLLNMAESEPHICHFLWKVIKGDKCKYKLGASRDVFHSDFHCLFVNQSGLNINCFLFSSCLWAMYCKNVLLLSLGFSFVSPYPCWSLLVLAFLFREGFKPADSPHILLAHASALCPCHCNEKGEFSSTVTSPPSTHSLLSSLCLLSLLSSLLLGLWLMVDGWSCDVIIPRDFLPGMLCSLLSSLYPSQSVERLPIIVLHPAARSALLPGGSIVSW